MKIFLDTAETDVVRKYYKTGLIDGLTTNPTLIRKSGRKHEDVYQEFKEIGVTDLSMEVIGNAENMISEGKRLHRKFGKMATIKVPCTVDGLIACKELAKDNIRVNVTLIFSAAQAILAARAGAAYISPFVGRVEDNSFDGVALIKEIAALYRKQYITKTEVLAASLRDVHSVSRCYEDGADIVTMPPAIFEKMYKHILTDKGLEQFDIDYAESVKE